MRTRIRALAGVAFGLVASAAVAQNTVEHGDWPTYGRDKGGQRFSPLTQITPANVATLAPAWTYHMKPPEAPAAAPQPTGVEAQQRAQEGLGPPPGAPPGARRRARSRFAGSQVTPLVVGGRMYVSTPYGRVVALDPATGTEIWATPIDGPGQPSLRGVEYWPGDAATPARLFFGTRDGRLLALDAATGKPSAAFGTNGTVEMKTPEIIGAGEARFYGMTSPPIVYGDLVITGSATQEFPPRGAAGDVRAWDARTGKLVWTFHTVPRKGESGYDSWAPGSAEGRSGVNAWGFLTVDEARGIVYMPLGAPAFDRYGGDRRGDNLYGTSLVAADAKTGRYLWHFQVVHHDIWDNDLQAPPLLFDAQVGGRTIPAVAITSKNGLLFVLDRTTGKPVHPVEERPFPKSDVPGEVTSPTQPIPVATPPLARTTFTMADVATVTPELNAWCKAWIAENRMVAGGLYVPVKLNQATISFPGLQGGGNWSGSAYDPRSGFLFTNTSDLGQVTSLVKSEGGPLPYERGEPSARFQQDDPKMMCQAPPWGRLSAVDTRTGKIAWAVPLGVTDTLPADKQRTGRPNIGGAIATASGLVFIGASDDARFRAFDSATGRELWTTKLDAAAHATPATYAAGGRQYVVIAATGGSFLDSPLVADTITAFALPTGAPQ